MPEIPSDLRLWSPRRIRTLDLPITRRMLGVDLDGSRRIEPAHVGRLVGPDGYRRIVWDDQGGIRQNRMARQAALGWAEASNPRSVECNSCAPAGCAGLRPARGPSCVVQATRLVVCATPGCTAKGCWKPRTSQPPRSPTTSR